MSDDTADTSQSVVKTYVPAYQKDEWREHAEELEMSQSEFVRTMVQAGRRGFDGRKQEAEKTADEEPGSGGSSPRGNDLEEQVLDVLSDGSYHEWSELLGALTEDIEDRLEETLQSHDRVQYSGRHGGYTLLEESE